MITITEDDFLAYSGIQLGLELNDLDDGSRKISRTISLWTKRVYQEMRRNSTRQIPDDKEMTEFQKAAIKDCICEYGTYYLKNGDLYRLSGYDEDKGRAIEQSEIDKIQFPQKCADMLRLAGLIKKGLGVRAQFSQDHDVYF